MCVFAKGGGVFFENSIVESDIRDNSDLNETADQQIVWTCTGGWGIFENYSVGSDSTDKSDLNETADQQIVSNHSTRGDFLNDRV